VEFVLTNRVFTGMNDASADSLSFVLTEKPDPFRIVAHGSTPDGWMVEVAARTNRIYGLERSIDLGSWIAIDSKFATNQTVKLQDPNPPVGQAFYRVSRRRP
jgi:hypothetical protein